MPGPRAKRPVERLEADEHVPHPRDRVDAELRPGAVGCVPGGLELEGDEAAVCDRDLQLGRLGDDRRVRGPARDDRGRADAACLLVADGGDDDVAA